MLLCHEPLIAQVAQNCSNTLCQVEYVGGIFDIIYTVEPA